MKHTIILILAIFLLSSCTQSAQVPDFFAEKGIVWKKNDKVFVLFRHAEKQTGEDPHLTPSGSKRAKELSNLLGLTPINTIFTTEFNRTRETVQFISEKTRIKPKVYDHKKLMEFASDLRSSEPGVHLISGHSNTTPTLANELCKCADFEVIDESDYTNLYVVVVNELATTTHQVKF